MILAAVTVAVVLVSCVCVCEDGGEGGGEDRGTPSLPLCRSLYPVVPLECVHDLDGSGLTLRWVHWIHWVRRVHQRFSWCEREGSDMGVVGIGVGNRNQSGDVEIEVEI